MLFGVIDMVHKAFCKNDAGDATTITCYLDVDGTGEEITVNFSILGPGGTKCNAAVPRLKDGSLIFVKKFEAWWCTTPLKASKNCDCYTE